jgi:hypothetical protein
MNDKTYEVQSLISYLHALAIIEKNGHVKVFAEINRTISKLERLLNDK